MKYFLILTLFVLVGCGKDHTPDYIEGLRNDLESKVAGLRVECAAIECDEVGSTKKRKGCSKPNLQCIKEKEYCYGLLDGLANALQGI